MTGAHALDLGWIDVPSTNDAKVRASILVEGTLACDDPDLCSLSYGREKAGVQWSGLNVDVAGDESDKLLLRAQCAHELDV
jgi:hypothetical protein